MLLCAILALVPLCSPSVVSPHIKRQDIPIAFEDHALNTGDPLRAPGYVLFSLPGASRRELTSRTNRWPYGPHANMLHTTYQGQAVNVWTYFREQFADAGFAGSETPRILSMLENLRRWTHAHPGDQVPDRAVTYRGSRWVNLRLHPGQGHNPQRPLSHGLIPKAPLLLTIDWLINLLHEKTSRRGELIINYGRIILSTRDLGDIGKLSIWVSTWQPEDVSPLPERGHLFVGTTNHLALASENGTAMMSTREMA